MPKVKKPTKHMKCGSCIKYYPKDMDHCPNCGRNIRKAQERMIEAYDKKIEAEWQEVYNGK